MSDKSEEIWEVPSPSLFSTCANLSMNICLLFSVCAPIGLDRSRKVAGFERSRVYRWKKSVKCSLEQHTLTRERQKCVWPHFWVVVSEDPGEDWILHQIIVRSPSDCVQVHQILKVTNFPFLEDGKMKRHGEKQRERVFCGWVPL